MNILKKKKNIFSEISKKKSIFLLNVFKHFGSRIIDPLIQNPLSYIDNNYKDSFEITEVGKIITLDLVILEHIVGYNKKSPLIVLTKTKSEQILKIVFFWKI